MFRFNRIVLRSPDMPTATLGRKTLSTDSYPLVLIHRYHVSVSRPYNLPYEYIKIHKKQPNKPGILRTH